MPQGNFQENLKFPWIKTLWEAETLYYCRDVCLLMTNHYMTEDVTFLSGKCDVKFRNYLMQLRSNGGFVSTQIVICTSFAVILYS